MSTDTTDEKIITCTDDMKNMHINTSTEKEVDVCANCGKEGSDLNICNKCKAAKYCNAACKKKHRTKHKKKCERRAAEIQAELHDIELLKQPPPREDCQICFLTLPSVETGTIYKVCCGKNICSGCIHAVELRDNGVGLCPFCRSPTPNNEELVKRTTKRVEVGDANAIFNLGVCYSTGEFSLQQDYEKAFELYHRAGELGYASAYYNGRGVGRDEKKAEHYYEQAAIRGDEMARYNLGNSELRAGNWDRALKHYMIAAGDGDNDSVKIILQLYKLGLATKEDYRNALQAYQTYLDEIRSEQRDKAAAYDEGYKYY